MAKKQTIRVRQVGSPIRRPKDQRKVLTGLGLGKLHREVELEDTPAVRGMVARVPHLAQIIED
ncbi:50S ribosomal protein L30 [Pacificimonas flava]|uniref:Large ribosomal subunit protein uL30 n=1 Tax=Pacificimonas flava TaxID=1234595 RepID=M2U2T6_9SPHN|nr:50S ribosomal protein L30 [Pacificimonas flava]EMD82277.1 LSU ribosomal protein L30p (L7e) [Pacificimonas flava]MBB5280815.1 large subunit ribosomal protein L30 [Pacificimonas flava]